MFFCDVVAPLIRVQVPNTNLSAESAYHRCLYNVFGASMKAFDCQTGWISFSMDKEIEITHKNFNGKYQNENVLGN